jgi:hypothetical protein
MSSIHVFLSGIIDYAGLFPPAQLPLRNAVENYAAYRHWFEKWMLGRFVCGIDRLAEMIDITRALQDESDGNPWGLTLLPRGAANSAEAGELLRDDLRAVDAAVEAAGVNVAADVFELKLPADLVAGSHAGAVRDFIVALLPIVKERPRSQPTRLFFEVPLTGDDWSAPLAPAVEGLASGGAAWVAEGQPAPGFKMRMGGADASAFPTVEAAAAAIALARDHRLAVKATAGLHHPLRHYNDVVETHMHGFLNVFMALMIATRHHLEPTRIAEILRDERGPDFRFEEQGCGWKELWLTLDDVSWIRGDRAIAFGSCSFHEPVEDLQKLGLIPYPPMFM